MTTRFFLVLFFVLAVAFPAAANKPLQSDWSTLGTVLAEVPTENAAPPSQAQDAPTDPQQSNQDKSSSPPAKADLSNEIKERLEEADALSKQVEESNKQFDLFPGTESNLINERLAMEGVIAKASETILALAPERDAVQSLLTKLGPAPDGKDVPKESDEIAAERARITELNLTIDGAIKKLELTQERARQLISKIQTARQNLFTENLFERTVSPLWPGIWQDVGQALPRSANIVNYLAKSWWDTAREKSFFLLLLVLLTGAAFWLPKHFLHQVIHKHLPQSPNPRPSFLQRASTAGWVAIARAIPMALSASVLYFGVISLDLIDVRLAPLWKQIYLGFLVFSAASALARAYLQPRRPGWRLLDVSTASAQRIGWIVKGMAALYAVDTVLQVCVQILFLPLPVSIAEALLVGLGFAGLLFALYRTDFTPSSASQPLPLSAPPALKVPIILVGTFVVLASLFGYIALGRFVAEQVVVTGTALVLILLVYLAIKSFAQPAHTDDTTPGQMLGAAFGFDETRVSYANWLITFVLNLALVLFAVPLLLLSLGIQSSDIASYGRSLLFGFEVAGLKISIIQILVGLGLFVGVLFVTRLLQRALASRVENGGTSDRGLANSVKTGIGYLGFIIACLAAISYVGLDITNLAIVAGALSVGIGFGLQSIVNNFVSGLILLVERPIKVGDLIEVGTQRGHVRKISVRSTEIETFDRASVIVPNSELISNSVTNLTHQNALGRLIIPVGVAYDADPRQVREILSSIAGDCPLILPYPEPSVSFEDFGASSLDFTLRAYVADVNNSLSAKTELRTRILLAFRDAGIEIPYPQQDLHLRDLDGVKKALGQAMAKRAFEQSTQMATDEGTQPSHAPGETPPATSDAKPAPGSKAREDNKKKTQSTTDRPLRTERDDDAFDSDFDSD